MKSASRLERTNNEDGIITIAAPKPGGYACRFDPTAFPST